MENKSNYNFLKTGFNSVEETLSLEEEKKNITTLVCCFAKNALKTAAMYVSHSSRNIVVVEDIKRSLMLEVFIFIKRPDLANSLKEIKELLFCTNEDEDGDENEYLGDTENTENSDSYQIMENDLSQHIIDNAQLTDDIPNEYCNSECECVLCNNLNVIKQKWLIWEPENNLQLLLKTHIDNMS